MLQDDVSTTSVCRKFQGSSCIQLVHLRYVALLGSFKVLPAAISNLRNLQTLVVETSSRNINVQADLWKLLQLKHVYTSAASDLPIPSSKSRKNITDPLVNVKSAAK
ncbi:hypothetical protein L2E82_10954 [Cichorium intybus]|uniref:Uncharacterized protein n=1 Tax=Cichorium intybus TaxID=13427 RepID=A0ACB9GBR8_CICIN|nr:hypothetical protein L2E82_10954 [Cichorium intybus]